VVVEFEFVELVFNGSILDCVDIELVIFELGMVVVFSGNISPNIEIINIIPNKTQTPITTKALISPPFVPPFKKKKKLLVFDFFFLSSLLPQF
jgi:hypothetical protein